MKFKKERRKTKMFSVTADDCRWDVFRGSGNGGQKKQKTSSGVRCVHEASGAVGESDDTRYQHINRKTAFERMAETPEFKSWMQLKIDAVLEQVEIEEMNERGFIVTRKLRGDEV